MRGHVQKRGADSWRLEVFLGRSPDGKKRYLERTLRGTRSEADQELARQTNYRLFCVLERDADDLGGSSIICIDGLMKPRRTAAKARDYRRALSYRDEFEKRRTVL